MRENLPITQHEYALPDGAMLVSKTDLKGRITFCNEAFIEASGFSMSELLGKAHNIVRHPDMPVEAYVDLWATLKARRPWTGLVKNRRKNGDFYWVLANATPIREGGAVTGYMSVRSKPTREQVEAAGALYRLFREKQAQGRVIREGKVIRLRFAGRLNMHSRGSLGQQTLAVGVLLAAAAVPGFVVLLAPGAVLEYRIALATVAIALTAFGFVGLWAIIRRIAIALRGSAAQVDELTQGRFEKVFEASGEDEVAGLQRSLQSLRTKVGFELADSRRLTVESTRIRQALDVAAANVMVADASHDIIYANRSLMQMLATAEVDIRQSLPSFNAAAVVGANIDQFHARPAHQREILSRLTGTHRTRLNLGARTIDLVITPILDDSGRRIGTVVEWADRTQELATEGQIESIVTGASTGDLTRRLEVDGMTGVFASVATGLNALLENMADLVSRVKAAAGQVRGGAGEISAGNMDLSQRTEQQAAALEETASSMEEMASSAKLSADNAAQADELASAARSQAETGGGVLSDTVAAMQGISASSNKIASIIGVIDEIAFQTNLLALNAAVEAARAGEQGRGFAVVASEVRNLAGRSAAAAKEIKKLIQDSVDRVTQGTALVNRSGQALAEIVTAVTKVTSVVAEMSNASREQAAGIEQVNKAVTSLDEVTQQNAALVEQAAAAAQSLLEQAAHLDEMMAKYTVSEATPSVETGRGDRETTRRDTSPIRGRRALSAV
jgi:methyl-accepting chemotaxis protein